MQIEAIYDHGRLELPGQIRFAHQRFTVRIDVPDDINDAYLIRQGRRHSIYQREEYKTEVPRHTEIETFEFLPFLSL